MLKNGKRERESDQIVAKLVEGLFEWSKGAARA